MLKPASESNPEYVHPWASIADRLSTTEYEDLSVHAIVEIFDALAQLAMETPTVRQYMDESVHTQSLPHNVISRGDRLPVVFSVAEREEDWDHEEKREAAAMLKTVLKEQRQRSAVTGSVVKATNAGVQRRMQTAFDAIEGLRDANKRQRAELFLHLPARQDLPDYYKNIARPISLYTVRERLRTGVVYTSWALLREDIELVFSNARSYNHETSEIYQDAVHLLSEFNRLAPAPEQQDVEAGGVTMDATVKVLMYQECRDAVERDGRLLWNEARASSVGRQGYVISLDNDIAQVKFQTLTDPPAPSDISELGRGSFGRVCSFPVACLDVVGERVSPAAFETKSQAEARVKLEASMKYEEMRDEHGSSRRECLGYDRHYRPYYIFGEDYAHVFCGTQPVDATVAGTSFDEGLEAPAHEPVCIHTVEELSRLQASLLPLGQRESGLHMGLKKVRDKCVTAMHEKMQQDQRYAAGYNLTKRALDRWAEAAACMEQLETHASLRLMQMDTSRAELYAKKLAGWKFTQQSEDADSDEDDDYEEVDEVTGMGTEGESATAGVGEAAVKMETEDAELEATEVKMEEGDSAAGVLKTHKEKKGCGATGRLLRLKQEMVAMEAALPSQARVHLATEDTRRDWVYKVVNTNHPGALCDLILELASSTHDSWLEPWWKPWKIIKQDTIMTKEEQAAAIASGMLEDPIKVKEAEVERKRKEEEERKKKKQDDLPVPWSDKEDADLKVLVCEEGIGAWIQKAVIHNARGYARTANALRHRFAQVVSVGMTKDELDTLKPDKPQPAESQTYCAACHGAHKKHVCGKQKGGHLSKEAMEAEEDFAVLDRARSSLEGSPAGAVGEDGEHEERESKEDHILRKENRAAVREARDQYTAEAAERARQAAEKERAEEAVVAAKAAAEAVVVAKQEVEERKKREEEEVAMAKQKEEDEAVAKVKAEEDAAAQLKSDGEAAVVMELEMDEERDRQPRSSTRGRKEPKRFEAGAAPAVIGGGESVVVKKTEAERAAERLPEEIRYRPIGEEAMSSTSIAFYHLWLLDAALKYQYRGNRSLRGEEELTDLREQMVDMWEVVVGLNDDTVDTDSDDEQYVAIVEDDPIVEGCRVEVIEAFGGAWVGQQGLVVSKDHGYVRVIFDGDDRGVLNLRLMHLKILAKPDTEPVIPYDILYPPPQLVEYYREKCINHQLVKWYTNDSRGYQEPKPEVEQRKRAEIFMVLPPRNDLPYYYRVIKRPIDLMMIKAKIDSDQYTDMWRFKEDMELMFDNARTFNSEESLVYEDANVLNDIFNEQLEQAGLGDIVSSRPDTHADTH